MSDAVCNPGNPFSLVVTLTEYLRERGFRAPLRFLGPIGLQHDVLLRAFQPFGLVDLGPCRRFSFYKRGAQIFNSRALPRLASART
ncbi:hypothetical protein [Cupriavidus sp. TMH.W2]|uniref:hypothetical protein n=1 Tax=Cupriavidus sp. TMH.W2 TaxID=3434465 RepID=UPI003D7869A8